MWASRMKGWHDQIADQRLFYAELFVCRRGCMLAQGFGKKEEAEPKFG